MIECDPVENEGTVKLAMPCALKAAVPSTFVPSIKATTPVGTPPLLVIETVRVSLFPAIEGLAEAISVPEVTACCTFCTIVEEMLPA